MYQSFYRSDLILCINSVVIRSKHMKTCLKNYYSAILYGYCILDKVVCFIDHCFASMGTSYKHCLLSFFHCNCRPSPAYMRGGPQRAAPKKADPGRYRSKPNSNTPDDRRGRPAPGRPGQDRGRDNRGKDRKKVGFFFFVC